MYKRQNEVVKKMTQQYGQIAILIDPEKVKLNENFNLLIQKINHCCVSFIFVGGSTVSAQQQKECIYAIRQFTAIPIVIFPGSHEQIDEQADAILFLNLISGRNPDFLIGHQVAAVPRLRQSNLEIIPTAYMLIDGGTETSVQRISKTEAISQDAFELALDTALAGVMMGNEILYLDAGSGAKNAVPTDWIERIRGEVEHPIIVGGGIRSVHQIESFFQAGANIVVIGNHIETNPEFLDELSAMLAKAKILR